jgi:hypothetical protein
MKIENQEPSNGPPSYGGYLSNISLYWFHSHDMNDIIFPPYILSSMYTAIHPNNTANTRTE